MKSSTEKFYYKSISFTFDNSNPWYFRSFANRSDKEHISIHATIGILHVHYFKSKEGYYRLKRSSFFSYISRRIKEYVRNRFKAL